MVEIGVVPYNLAMAHRASSSTRLAPTSLFFAVAAWLLVPALGACGDDGTEGTGGSTGTTSGAAGGDASSGGGDGTGGGAGGDDRVVTECGTFDPTPDAAGDSAIPDDPASPSIVASCERFCDAFADVCAGGGFLRDDCVDDCRLRACGICAGTLEPLVDCEAAEGDAAACDCQEGIPVCEMPDACLELRDETSQCGG